MNARQRLEEALMHPHDILVDAGNYKNDYYSSLGYTKGATLTRWRKTAADIIETIDKNGALSEEDIKNAIIFGYVCIDADQYRLNVLEAIDDLNVQLLVHRYLKGGKNK